MKNQDALILAIFMSFTIGLLIVLDEEQNIRKN